MADITPFKGILYNPSKITNLADVVAPPFDIISKQEQHRFHETHPNNIIRLTLGRVAENDTEKNKRLIKGGFWKYGRYGSCRGFTDVCTRVYHAGK